MDSGWAAILGAVIGLIGSTIAGVIAPAIIGRREQHAVEAKALVGRRADVIKQFIRACADSYVAGEDGAPLISTREVALADLALLISTDELPVLKAAEHASSAVSGENQTVAASALVEMTRLLPSWHRGEISPTELKREYDASVAKAEAKANAEES